MIPLALKVHLQLLFHSFVARARGEHSLALICFPCVMKAAKEVATAFHVNRKLLFHKQLQDRLPNSVPGSGFSIG